jgi:hypothetical protein
MASENPDELDQVRAVIEEMFGMATDEIDSNRLGLEHSEASNSRPSLPAHKEKLG